eukprot:12409323-Karenia_brevis.AAC.1
MILARGCETVFLASSGGQAKLAYAILGGISGLGKSRQVGHNEQAWNTGYWQLGEASLGKSRQ